MDRISGRRYNSAYAKHVVSVDVGGSGVRVIMNIVVTNINLYHYKNENISIIMCIYVDLDIREKFMYIWIIGESVDECERYKTKVGCF